MSQIQVTDLTYGYEGSFDTVFENVSFGIDADWKKWKRKNNFFKFAAGKKDLSWYRMTEIF